MTIIANASQFEAWNGDSGRRWVATRGSSATRSSPRSPTRCSPRPHHLPGAAFSTSDAAAAPPPRQLPPQSAQRARRPASTSRLPCSTWPDSARPLPVPPTPCFVHGDAQTYAFEPDSIDLVISRFGTMFFSDPDAAFSNIANGASTRWATLSRHLATTRGQRVAHRPRSRAPASHPDCPRRHRTSRECSPSRTPRSSRPSSPPPASSTSVIEAANVTFTLGQTVEDAVEYLADSGPGRALLETIPEGPAP